MQLQLINYANGENIRNFTAGEIFMKKLNISKIHLNNDGRLNLAVDILFQQEIFSVL